jgi:hypothetical protein
MKNTTNPFNLMNAKGKLNVYRCYNKGVFEGIKLLHRFYMKKTINEIIDKYCPTDTLTINYGNPKKNTDNYKKFLAQKLKKKHINLMIFKADLFELAFYICWFEQGHIPEISLTDFKLIYSDSQYIT